ncbi:MAG: PIG-L family deacetylase [Actinomycetota bacterium]|nr:PIG-L family deacetylase [Actinomycetota bacterium]
MPTDLLVVTAHPDDEVLIAGGILAACTRAGRSTAVICLTRGELGVDEHPAGPRGASLAIRRRDELLASCARLGVSTVKCWRRPDGDLRSVRRGPLVAQLVRAFDSLKPAMVITFGEDGLYYHPDHVVVHELVMAALAAQRSAAPQLYEAQWPSAVSVALTSALSARALPAELWGIPPADFGVEQIDCTHAVDVRPFVADKLAALRCHATQLGPRHAFSQLPLDLAVEHLGREYLRPPDGDGLGVLRQWVSTGASVPEQTAWSERA